MPAEFDFKRKKSSSPFHSQLFHQTFFQPSHHRHIHNLSSSPRQQSSSSSCSSILFLIFLSSIFNMSPFRSTLITAGLLALSSSAVFNPAAALSITPGALSSFRVTGGQQLGEGLQGSAQQCLDACFGVAGCNAASFCASAAGGGCEGGKAPSTCVWFRVDDPYNPPGEASANWLSGTISSTGQQQAQQVQQPVQQQQQQVQQVQQPPPPVVVVNGGNNGVRPAAAAAATAVVVRNRNQNPNPIIPVPPVVHRVGPGRRMQSAAAVATTAVVVRRRNQNPNPIIPVPPVAPVVAAHPVAATAAVGALPVGAAAATTAVVVRNRNQNPNPVIPVPPVVHPFGGGRRMKSAATVATTAVVVRNRNQNPSPVVPVPPVVHPFAVPPPKGDPVG